MIIFNTIVVLLVIGNSYGNYLTKKSVDKCTKELSSCIEDLHIELTTQEQVADLRIKELLFIVLPNEIKRLEEEELYLDAGELQKTYNDIKKQLNEYNDDNI